MVGREYEAAGIVNDGSKMINAVSNSTVPAITIMLGASYGAGNYAMCGRAYAPRFLFGWCNSRVSVMGPEQLSGVMDLVMREAARKRGVTVDEDMAKAQLDAFRGQVEQTSDAYYVSARCIDDGLIDPRQTRQVVGLCLALTHGAAIEGTMRFGVHRM
mmetsp:Transcript_40806/g.100395  ORF Transcript_40806/g.100395 Transcript_40806/m.100395 type:complete len:158 (+) Transcript_40806:2-475(+)